MNSRTILSDLRAEDVIHVNDRLVIEAQVSKQGAGLPDSVPVTLSEIRDGQQVELAREMVRLDAQGKPLAPIGCREGTLPGT